MGFACFSHTQAQNSNKWWLPQGGNAIHHSHYSLAYAEEHELALWVGYQLTANEVGGLYQRSDNFKEDPAVKTGTAQDYDYKGSGYDRGHLAPAADMAFSAQAMRESFYYSNIAPQHPSFNRGIWKKLEALCRAWAVQQDSIYIISGPVLTNCKGTLGVNKVSIPSYYYKIVLSHSAEGYAGIAFIMPNQRTINSLNRYVFSIDSVEALTGLDFFPALADEVENKLEAQTTGAWDFNLRLAPSTNTKKLLPGSYCQAKTKSGTRCKRKVKGLATYCWQHGTDGTPTKSHKKTTASRCLAITQKGNRCRRKTKNGNGLCWQHQ
jgi:endonuclease G